VTKNDANNRGRARNVAGRMIVAVFFLFAVCAVAPSKAQETGSGNPFDLIHAGDLIEIDVLGSIEFDWRGRITPEGYLLDYEHSPERLFALCLSPEKFALEVASAIGRVLKDPVVAVRILDASQRTPAVVFGAVRTPQRFFIKRSVRLAELIVLAGGLTDRLSGEIQIFRPPGVNCATRQTDNESEFGIIRINDLLAGDRTANPEIQNGDVVTVGEANPVWVVGGVSSPRAVLFRGELTVSRAIASAGGLTKDARAEDVAIIRRTPAGSRVIAVDLGRIASKADPDLALERFDIVDVGRRGRERRNSPVPESAAEVDTTGKKMPLTVVD
jgi:protein involved in polysaccharide export with SLBB domain